MYIMSLEGLIPTEETKALISFYREADLRFCFRICETFIFVFHDAAQMCFVVVSSSPSGSHVLIQAGNSLFTL